MTGRAAIDRDAYPAAARYLDALPRGLGSYPACENKASLLRSALDVHPMTDADGLPPALLELIRRPPLVSSWIPAVHDLAIKLAIFDRHFASREDYARFAYESQLALFSGPLYSFAMRRLGPARLARRIPDRWRQLHRGTALTSEHVGRGRATLLHEVPTGLYDDLLFDGLEAGLRAALVTAGALDVSLARARVDSRRSRFAVLWR